MHRTSTAVILAATLALAGCSDSDIKADAKPSAISAVPSPSQTVYTIDDCKALMEEGYASGTPSDVSDEPECERLTEDEYVAAVGDVLKGHVDDIMADAADEAMYDEVWDTLDVENQQMLCDTMTDSSSETVGALLESMLDDPSVDADAMAQYYYDEKC
ncbi:hypothetical protein WJ438_04115 [Streptomyces sp. GD-15H]|uniref:hypothetical protein n=1 Tax=Streptomyces sp. GD-15H TaxID=3129112 RepID=UPI0032550F03